MNPPEEPDYSKAPKTPQRGVGYSAFLVAAGIFSSKIAGLVRERIFAYYFGNSAITDAFRQAMRIPNFLQNLFGEGVLSASFIPVYAKLVAQDEREEAGRVAGAIFSILALLTATLALLGVLATPYFINVIAPGFKGETRRLTIQLVRIVFPGVGLLVLSAWCLGILNSHGKFFLSYASPVLWNAAFIGVLIIFGRRSDLPHLAVYGAYGLVLGSAMQFLIQVPVVLKLAPKLRIFFSFSSLGKNVRIVLRNFTPVFVSRGVVQLSATVDSILASYLPTTAVSSLTYAQTVYLLPVSLFGMSISAAELPAMSSALGNEQQVAETLRGRISASTRRIGYFVVPSAVAFVALGDVVAAAIYQTGKFTYADAQYVWGVLAGSAVGLVAMTVGRLYSSAYYALRDTRTPLRFAILRVVLTTVLGYLSALPLPRLLGIDAKWGVAGLTASAGVSAWLEFLLLRRGMNRRIGRMEFPTAYFAKLWLSAGIAAGVAWGLKLWLHPKQPQIAAVVLLLPYGLAYLALTMALRISEAGAIIRRLMRSG
ncbi:MAG TPA: murein biosynthesis integral membrane protein MurJ [Candidatus Angelobacter sp.]|jgi:putative peptidoglycan lipid II flippase|nr:murein biosynthesis integral membrane protein MurJ [Candidatus Angelobacter sp.]